MSNCGFRRSDHRMTFDDQHENCFLAFLGWEDWRQSCQSYPSGTQTSVLLSVVDITLQLQFESFPTYSLNVMVSWVWCRCLVFHRLPSGHLEMPHSRPCGTPSWEFMKSSGGLYETRVTWTKKIMVALCLGFQNSRVESLLKSTATNLKMEFAIFSLFARTRQDRWWWGLTEAPRMWIWITKSGLSFSKNVSYGAE